MKETLKIVFVIIGTLIGAGFASGQEIYVFFYAYGKVRNNRTCSINNSFKYNNLQNFNDSKKNRSQELQRAIRSSIKNKK